MSEPIYIPAPQDPAAFNRRIAKLGGFSPNGLPRLQVVWGMDATEWRSGDPKAIKYLSFDKDEVGMPFWIVEQWYPPTTFDEKTWETDRWDEGVDLMGPFPSDGFYGMLFPWVNEDSKYAPLGENLYQVLKLNVAAKHDKELDQKLIKEQMQRKENLKQMKSMARLKTRNENMDRYFTREDYYTNQRAYSFASRIIRPVTEKRTEAGIILPD